jgi:hypothetical protein
MLSPTSDSSGKAGAINVLHPFQFSILVEFRMLPRPSRFSQHSSLIPILLPDLRAGVWGKVVRGGTLRVGERVEVIS